LDLVINNIHIPIEKDGMDEYIRVAAQKMGIDTGDISVIKILGKALDLRKQEQFIYTMSLVIKIDDSFPNKQQFNLYTKAEAVVKKVVKMQERPVIVGFGPAGIFAALELISHGLKPLIFERGKKIEERSVDVEIFIKDRKLNPESNIQFPVVHQIQQMYLKPE